MNQVTEPPPILLVSLKFRRMVNNMNLTSWYFAHTCCLKRFQNRDACSLFSESIVHSQLCTCITSSPWEERTAAGGHQPVRQDMDPKNGGKCSFKIEELLNHRVGPSSSRAESSRTLYDRKTALVLFSTKDALHHSDDNKNWYKW